MTLNHVNKNKITFLDAHNTVPLSTKKYINASFVSAPKPKSFIATQGPIPASIDDFWQMVFDYNVEIIVMLCSLSENGREKCCEYWNDKIKKISFKVNVLEEKKDGPYLKIRTIVIEKGGVSKKVTQFHFLGWPDHGAPDIEDVYSTFDEMIKMIHSEKPVVVHCSAGVGRTGTFITLYNLYNEIIKGVNTGASISIFNMVRKLKEMRMFLVESLLQYRFVYLFISKLMHKLIKN